MKTCSRNAAWQCVEDLGSVHVCLWQTQKEEDGTTLGASCQVLLLLRSQWHHELYNVAQEKKGEPIKVVQMIYLSKSPSLTL